MDQAKPSWGSSPASPSYAQLAYRSGISRPRVYVRVSSTPSAAVVPLLPKVTGAGCTSPGLISSSKAIRFMTRSGPPTVTFVVKGAKVAPSDAPVTRIVPDAPSALPSAAVRPRSAMPLSPGRTPSSWQTAVAPVTSQSTPVSSATVTSAMPATPLRSTVYVTSPSWPAPSSSPSGLLTVRPSEVFRGEPLSGYGCRAVSAGPPIVRTGPSARAGVPRASEPTASSPAAASPPAVRRSAVSGERRVIANLWGSTELCDCCDSVRVRPQSGAKSCAGQDHGSGTAAGCGERHIKIL